MPCRKDGTRLRQLSSRPAGGVASAPKRGWSYRGRPAPDGRGFDSPQLHFGVFPKFEGTYSCNLPTVKVFANCAKYQTKTERLIPTVFVEPIA